MSDIDAHAARVEEKVTVARTPEELYDMVADLTRMGEWSPSNQGGRWESGGGPVKGAVFIGVNLSRAQEYETRSEIVVADRPREIAWVAGGAADGWARWGYRFDAIDGGTVVTESWEPANLRRLVPDATHEFVARMGEGFRAIIRTTLEELKACAEA